MDWRQCPKRPKERSKEQRVREPRLRPLLILIVMDTVVFLMARHDKHRTKEVEVDLCDKAQAAMIRDRPCINRSLITSATKSCG